MSVATPATILTRTPSETKLQLEELSRVHNRSLSREVLNSIEVYLVLQDVPMDLLVDVCSNEPEGVPQ